MVNDVMVCLNFQASFDTIRIRFGQLLQDLLEFLLHFSHLLICEQTNFHSGPACKLLGQGVIFVGM